MTRVLASTPWANEPTATWRDHKACRRCGIIRPVKPGRDNDLCKDCRSVERPPRQRNRRKDAA